jgi:hypothetical protein
MPAITDGKRLVHRTDHRCPRCLCGDLEGDLGCLRKTRRSRGHGDSVRCWHRHLDCAAEPGQHLVHVYAARVSFPRIPAAAWRMDRSGVVRRGLCGRAGVPVHGRSRHRRWIRLAPASEVLDHAGHFYRTLHGVRAVWKSCRATGTQSERHHSRLHTRSACPDTRLGKNDGLQL